MYTLDCGRKPEVKHMLRGKVYTDLYEVTVFLYAHPGRWYAKEISGHTGVGHASVLGVSKYLREKGLVDWEQEKAEALTRAPRIYIEINQHGRIWFRQEILEKAKEILPLVEEEY
jgi:hypothetical protein